MPRGEPNPQTADEATNALAGRNGRITREEILSVAVRMFSRRGYRATNLGDVAAELGVTRQAIYYYFAKKDDILVALFTLVFDELEGKIEGVEGESDSAIARLNAMLLAHLEVVARYPAHINFVLTEQETLPAATRRAMHARRWAYHTRFVSVHEAAVAEGSCVDLPSDYVVSYLLSAANVSSRWLSRVGSVDPVEFARNTHMLMASGYQL